MILSEQNINEIDFQKSNGLVPAIIQDGNSGQVLMLGYMDRDAVLQTFKLKRVTFYSRSKERLWTKGESSGHYLKFKEMCLDCDADSLLIQADPMGPTCHTGADSCFGNEKWGLSFIEHLQGVIADRQRNPSTTSYTSSLFDKGIDKIAQKVGEEAVETVIEAKNENRDKFLGETADLLFHLLILLKAKNVNIQDVLKVLMQRHK